jgi:hypothetical protein
MTVAEQRASVDLMESSGWLFVISCFAFRLSTPMTDGKDVSNIGFASVQTTMGVLWAAQDRELVQGWGRAGRSFLSLRF